ncbi:uncharacterized protein LOC111706370 [Eurytemora carolleeae]|uniref:uncharacterized protein LOC111706370 n=1 Tax=Eurytemora carolleeae TaxID=1294199 RepID=UPI000C77DCFA|nr:uncharacterized protein LOC111706370 [Eurytemora carolleeae]|eukprot:XP_023335000.1 uncharacterized protein LOC111706370 [Eurytemora affinis]
MSGITDLEDPNTVHYEDEGYEGNKVQTRPSTGKLWSTQGDKDLEDTESLSPSLSPSQQIEAEQGLSEEDTKILLEKEFDDFYEDRIHKSAGPVVFLSKCLGMIPLIWTDDEEGSECKTYFNIYTFVVFLGWIGLSVLTGMRINLYTTWPAQAVFTPDNSTTANRFLGRMTVDTYAAAIFSNCLVAVVFGVFKSRMFADVLFYTAQIDSQLELKEKSYDKIKAKSLFWIVLEILLFAGHGVGLFFLFEDIGRDLILFGCFLLANLAIGVLNLQVTYVVVYN